MKETGGKQEKSNTRKIVNGLLNYSVAAAATVAMAQPLQAAVVQSGPQFITLNPDDYSYIDLNGDMIVDFALVLYSHSGLSYGALLGGSNNAAMVYPLKYFASRLCSEEVPGDTDSFNDIAITHINYDGYRYGQFSGKNGSIGVRFQIPEGQNEETHYGYIRLWVSGQGNQVVIKDWAYEDVPDTSILTPPCGEVIRSDTDPTTVPTLNQWGILFFMGLILLEGGRRLKKESGKKA